MVTTTETVETTDEPTATDEPTKRPTRVAVRQIRVSVTPEIKLTVTASPTSTATHYRDCQVVCDSKSDSDRDED